MQEPEHTLPKRARLLPQLLKFGVVGGLGVIINFVVFNGLMLLVLTPEKVPHAAVWATVIGTLVAIAANWVGNRYWAFASQHQNSSLREGVEFFLVSLAGLCIPVACVWFANDVLGLTSLPADNVANYVVGLGLGTLFRFVLYRFWVFAPSRRSTSRSETTGAAETASSIAETSAAPASGGIASLPGAPDSGLIGGS